MGLLLWHREAANGHQKNMIQVLFIGFNTFTRFRQFPVDVPLKVPPSKPTFSPKVQLGLSSNHEGSSAGGIGGTVETVKPDSHFGNAEFHRVLHVVVVEGGQGAMRQGYSVRRNVDF
jgi:hypothetical protein